MDEAKSKELWHKTNKEAQRVKQAEWAAWEVQRKNMGGIKRIGSINQGRFDRDMMEKQHQVGGCPNRPDWDLISNLKLLSMK